jgi:RNA polymerase sigma factor (TIGR02999 family)
LREAVRGLDLGVDREFSAAYLRLRRIAARHLLNERQGHTLDPTALVHEAYLKLKDSRPDPPWHDHSHFLAWAGRAMRQVLVDYARRGKAAKRRGHRVDWTLSAIPLTEALSPDDLLALDEALSRLEAQGPNGPRQARLIDYVWFGGMDVTEAAEILGISRRQAHRDWAWARTWLAREMDRG